MAELDGANNASEIQKALHPLRVRVNMPDVDFDREYNTDADYPFHNLDKYIQAMRRERRVEKALENCRLTDYLKTIILSFFFIASVILNTMRI